MTVYARIQRNSALVVVLVLSVLTLSCGSRPPIDNRVPDAHIEKAIALEAPFGNARKASPEIVDAGKALYEGKGTCHLCHGVSGKGDGPTNHMHVKNHPRDFTDCAFQMDRDDGELFWIIKYGSAGTSMPATIPNLLSEDEGWKVVAYLRTFCKTQSHQTNGHKTGG
ncbi:MAG: cytochrome c [Nitrospira sp.]|nr:cytochrome c [Nitrospira sp.]MBX3349484.1 cytochrome c [Nitrospira sp.]